MNTYSKLKAMVEANAVEWDVVQIELLGRGNYRACRVCWRSWITG